MALWLSSCLIVTQIIARALTDGRTRLTAIILSTVERLDATTHFYCVYRLLLSLCACVHLSERQLLFFYAQCVILRSSLLLTSSSNRTMSRDAPSHLSLGAITSRHGSAMNSGVCVSRLSCFILSKFLPKVKVKKEVRIYDEDEHREEDFCLIGPSR